MRLWHYALIPYLPRQQLLGQWRELCLVAKNISEKGTPGHILVNKVADYPERHLVAYAYIVYHNMTYRGYKPDVQKFLKYTSFKDIAIGVSNLFSVWHTTRYLKQCINNLAEKHDCGAIPEEEWSEIERWVRYDLRHDEWL